MRGRPNTAAAFWTALGAMSPGECWIWPLGQWDGYGRWSMAGITIPAHRASYIYAFGDIPDGLCVCHSCDVPLCCNPDHLWLGTNLDNQIDKVTKNRQAMGEVNGRAKLSTPDVEGIKASPLLSEYGGLSRLARKYGVSPTTIWRIRHGIGWNGTTVLGDATIRRVA